MGRPVFFFFRRVSSRRLVQSCFFFVLISCLCNELNLPKSQHLDIDDHMHRQEFNLLPKHIQKFVKNQTKRIEVTRFCTGCSMLLLVW